MTATHDATIAGLQRTIAELQRERDAALSEQTALAEALDTRTAELARRTAELATRNSEFGERIDHQAATLDVLKAMSASPGDPQPVFDLIVERARAYCDAELAALTLLDGDLLQLHATSGMTAARTREFAAAYPLPVSQAFAGGRAILMRDTVQIPDTQVDPGFAQRGVNAWHRSVLAVPLLHAGTAIGAIGLGRPTPGAYSAAQAELLKTFAEQAVIAIGSAETYHALQARTAALTQRNSEYGERIEHQAATIDVLKAMSASPGDPQPVFDLIVERARDLCNAYGVTVLEFDGGLLHYRAANGISDDAETREAFAAMYLRPPTRDMPQGRAILDRRTIRIDDLEADQGLNPFYRGITAKSTVVVPLMRGEVAIGTVGIGGRERGGFSDSQIELLNTFAEQAVIAITSAETYRALQTRTADLQETLEYQTATSDVLKVISGSDFTLEPVFQTVVDTAVRLCRADQAVIYRLQEGAFRWAAGTDMLPEYERIERAVAIRPGTGSLIGRVALQGRPVQIPDAWTDPLYEAKDDARAGGVHTILGVPLLLDGETIGAIGLARTRVEPFTDRQIELVSTFADQAVIAIENTRLLTEQREALEQQTATAEVLEVINASPGDLAPVFDAILEKAHTLCGVAQGALVIFDGEFFRASATRGLGDFASVLQEGFRPRLGSPQDKLLNGEHFVHIADVGDIDDPTAQRCFGLAGVRTVLYVAMRKDHTLLGYIAASHKEVRPFSDNQIALLQNFAAQAVIAMANAQLLTETREALEQQTATAEVLQVINSSPGDLAPVFDAILERAMRLCEAAFGVLWTLDGDAYRATALRGVTPEFAEFVASQRRRPEPDTALGQLASGESFVHVADVASRRTTSAVARKLEELGSIRTLLAVPLRREQEVLGAFHIYRQEVRPFSDKQIALLQNFAAQAVIAMENARLINETREALEQQTATAEVLQVINSNPGNLAPVFDAMLEKAHGLCGIAMGSLELYDGQRFHAVAVRGLSDAFADMLRQGYPASENPATGPLIDGGRLTHIRDLAETDYAITRSGAELDAARTLLCVPLRREGTLLGMIASSRREVRPFSDKEIALLENFAAQAVIAMENARLLTEQREALERQTATAEVLQVINASPGNLGPVFEAMLDKALRLCDASFGVFWQRDGESFYPAALHGVPEAFADHLMRNPVSPSPNSGVGRSARGEPFVHITDIADSDAYRSGDPQRRALVDLGGGRTALWVGLRRDGHVPGVFTIYRKEVRPFTDKQIALLENFAAQAVIAMENARLLEEVRQRQEELRITFENMGDGVAMFDDTQHLVAWNRKFQDILDVPDDIIARRQTFSEYIRYLAERGEYGADADVEEQVRRVLETVGQMRVFERVRPNGRVIEVRSNPVAAGGFVLIYSDITERKRNEAEIRTARDAAEEASRTIEAAYRDLKAAQANLIQAEKMASLGQLTAGIAHEIKNPLNFVNNFAALSVDLLGELKETAAPGFAALTDRERAEIEEVSVMLTGNLEKIAEHGRRADGIVKAMLEHSRGSSGERRMVDLNALIDEALNLAYHGARAQDPSFNITLERDFGEGIDPIEINPQDITRVFLNLFSNGFYAATRRARHDGDAGFAPTLKVSTRGTDDAVEIRVRDNGTGIPTDIRDKLFQPFFTTKPTGEGTGLGLSITYDIVTQQHGGDIAVDSEIGDYSEFAIRLPRQPQR